MASPTTPHHPSTVAVSAPGKVLLAGGYLVLDRRYTGLALGLSARISVVASRIDSSPGVELNEIVVESRQFMEAQWRYGYRLTAGGGGIKVTQLQVDTYVNPNPFVETTLNYALSYVNTVVDGRESGALSPSRLVILADKDYYSQPPMAPATEQHSRFFKFGVKLVDAHKTGLGSSAALVTSLTAALLAHYLPSEMFSLSTDRGKRTLHRLAQAAHCAAQGKVGSGFDVAAAVYGSCTYRRFSPELLRGMPEPGAPGFADKLATLVDDGDDGDGAWDVEVVVPGGRRSLPRGLTLRMCDVDCGSQTVGMVNKVLAWRALDAVRCNELWDELQRRNEALALALGLTGEGESDGGDGGGVGDLDHLPQRISDVRELMRKMGELSDVPIEPVAQTALLDALTQLDGVYGGVVPGAGGFDAAALLMDDDDAAAQRVGVFLDRWSHEKSCRVKLLDVRGEMEGVCEEKLSLYDGWLD